MVKSHLSRSCIWGGNQCCGITRNPDRIGCRGSVALRQTAERRFPHPHPFWDEHVSRCSPCYAEFLVERDRVLQKWDRKERLFKFVVGVTIVGTLALAIHRLFR